MQTHTQPPALTDRLFADLLDSTIDTFAVCHRNGLGLDELRAIVESRHFEKSIECLRAIHAARTAAILPAMQADALATLAAVAAQEPTTPTHTETVRRAAAAVLRHKPPGPADETPPAQQPRPEANVQDAPAAEPHTQDAPAGAHARRQTDRRDDDHQRPHPAPAEESPRERAAAEAGRPEPHARLTQTESGPARHAG